MSMLTEAVSRIKNVTSDKVRKMSNSKGKVDLQINESGNWVTILPDLNPNIADDVIRQASNKVLLG